MPASLKSYLSEKRKEKKREEKRKENYWTS